MVFSAQNSVATPLQVFTDASGIGTGLWKLFRKQASGMYTIQIDDVVLNGYEMDFDNSISSISLTVN